jgi:hypothetical protein
MDTSFDPAGELRFDRSKGSIFTAENERVMMLPASACEEIAKAGGDAAGAAVGLLLGAMCGRRVAARFGGAGAVNAASADAIVAELGGQIALAGLGLLRLERRGRAMMFVLERAAVGVDRMISAALEGALLAATGRDLACVPLARERGDRVRVLVASRPTAARVREWIAAGLSWSQALARLQGAGA